MAGNPARRLRRDVVLNLCNMYEATFDATRAVSRKRTLQHVAEAFGVRMHASAFLL